MRHGKEPTFELNGIVILTPYNNLKLKIEYYEIMELLLNVKQLTMDSIIGDLVFFFLIKIIGDLVSVPKVTIKIEIKEKKKKGIISDIL